MFTLYANWSGEPIATGATLDEARAAMSGHPCAPDTVFGAKLVDVTAISGGQSTLHADGALVVQPFEVVEVQGIVRLH